MRNIKQDLLNMQDKKYKEFQLKLMPTVENERVIGIRTPVLRKYAAEIYKQGLHTEFMTQLPHEYYEENNLHGIFICKTHNFEKCIAELDRFLPYVDNWASCDILNPKVLQKNPKVLLKKIKQWLKSEHTYTVRYAIKCLMDNFLTEYFSDEILVLVSNVKHEDYYVKMMMAWFFATALAKQYDSTIIHLEEKRLPEWVHNKTIQKSIESYRISDEEKTYLRSLKL